MKLSEAQVANAAQWIDLGAQMRRNRHSAKQTQTVETLHTLAARHKELSAGIAAGVEREAQREAAVAAAEAVVARRQKQIAGMEAKLNSGDGLTSRDLVALQADIETTRGLLDSEETAELHEIERLELTEAKIAQLRAEAAEVAATGAQLQKERTSVAAQLDAQLADLTAQRARHFDELPAQVQSEVEQGLKNGSQGLTGVSQGACGACGTTLSGSAASQFSSAERGELLRCDECEVLLVKL